MYMKKKIKEKNVFSINEYMELRKKPSRKM